MTVIEIRFPAGRFHATPWGRHVNEGAVEWPPSPWRILRALIATWHLKARDEIPKETVRGLVNLLSKPPEFYLPRATTAHTRHYMPYNEGKNEKTTKVFDAFIQIAEGMPLKAMWDVDLSAEQFDALRRLSELVGYLGRAESLVEMQAFAGVTELEANSKVLFDDVEQPPETELVRTLTAMNPQDYANWRKDFSAKSNKAADGKKKEKKATSSEVPDDIFKALHADTGELQAAGWNLPPGARYMNYVRPENAFAPAAKRPRRLVRIRLTVARYSLTSVVPPSLLQAVSVADQIHTQLVSLSDGHPIFTGAGGEGNRHAHIFCESEESRGHITHITVYAREPFDERAVTALRKLQWSPGRKGHELRLVLHGIGQESAFENCALFKSSTEWWSITPFVATRHAKGFRDGRPKLDESGWQIGSPPHDLLRLLALHPHGGGASIRQINEKVLPYNFGDRRVRSLQFQTVRHGGNGSHGHQPGAAFTIKFPEPRTGPFALGYGSHFGLGLFAPQQ
jgi:CRISPR-associated protein Csb2